MIIVLGDIAVDIVSLLQRPLIRGSDAAAEVCVMPGGSGANVAVWLARLGQPVTFIGRIGDDLFGRWLADDLAREGVLPALAVDRQRRTGMIQVLVEPDGERTMVPDRGANAHWHEEDASEDLIAAADLLHIVGYVLLDAASRRGALQAMAHARRHHVPISLDPSTHAALVAETPARFWQMVGPVDLLLPNRSEAQTLAATTDLDVALAVLRGHARVVAIKLDRDGCLARTAAGRWRAAAPPAQIVNATGAGDAFNAAFMARWLRDGDVAAACRAGVALGTYAATLPTTR